MRYVFILGRNSVLSKAEIFSYFEKENIPIEIIEEAERYLLLETEKEMPKIIDKLGGIIAIGRVLFLGNFENVKHQIKNKNIYNRNKNNFSYAILNFSNENIEEILKEKFKKEKFKAVLKHYETPLKLKEVDIVYFLTNKNFGIITEIFNTEEIEKRDMQKPERRNELAISPRLAKILINLSKARENEILLDPFCGVGVILQESLLQNINVIGIDTNKKALEKAKKNISWIERNYEIKSKSKLLNADSRKIKIEKIDAIATEPELGSLFKKIPKKEEAEETIKKFERLIIEVFNNLKKYLKENGRIAFTSPYIKTNKERVSANIKKIAEETKLKIIISGIKEFREFQIVGRELCVLAKE